jgi:hypothetical protein
LLRRSGKTDEEKEGKGYKISHAVTICSLLRTAKSSKNYAKSLFK